MTQEAQPKLPTDRRKSAEKGILLPHDSETQTAAVRYLRDNRYRVVHVVPTVPAKAAADVQKSEKCE